MIVFGRERNRGQSYEDLTMTLRKRDIKSWMENITMEMVLISNILIFLFFFPILLEKWRARPPIKSPGTRNTEARGRGRFPPDRLLRLHCVYLSLSVLFIM